MSPETLVPICHEGAPADPPIVNGHHFRPIEGGLYFAEVPQADADELLRIPSYRPFGGAKPAAADPDPEPVKPGPEPESAVEEPTPESPAEEEAPASVESVPAASAKKRVK